MEILKKETAPGFKIETNTMPDGRSISYCPERGILTSSKLFNGEEVVEVFYMDKETLNNKELSVKGGNPVLFPNAGPIPEEIKTEELKNLKQHGFARDQKWESIITSDGIDATLNANNVTREFYPYDFSLSLKNKLEEDNSLSIIQSVKNLEEKREMPVSFGLHPYFNVINNEKMDSLELKKKIKFNFEGGKSVEEQVEIWGNGKAINIDNPGKMKIEMPSGDVLVLNVSKEYEKIWVWSLPEKDFICVEPVMRNKGGIITDPEMVKPGDIYSASFNIKLEKNK